MDAKADRKESSGDETTMFPSKLMGFTQPLPSLAAPKKEDTDKPQILSKSPIIMKNNLSTLMA
jgi:hypothetical protein